MGRGDLDGQALMFSRKRHALLGKPLAPSPQSPQYRLTVDNLRTYLDKPNGQCTIFTQATDGRLFVFNYLNSRKPLGGESMAPLIVAKASVGEQLWKRLAKPNTLCTPQLLARGMSNGQLPDMSDQRLLVIDTLGLPSAQSMSAIALKTLTSSTDRRRASRWLKIEYLDPATYQRMHQELRDGVFGQKYLNSLLYAPTAG